LPDEISFGGGKKLTFVYDAMGRKLSKRVYDGTSVEERSYFGGIEYRNGQLERVATSAGSVTKQQTASVAFRYEYVLSDHLGNMRAVISDLDDNGLLSVGSEVIQVNHYYPYGLNMQGPWNGSAGSYKYQYNGKELTDALNLNWNDYGARYYDAARIQWTGVDPLSEKYMAYGGYHYVMNNPVRLIDPNGMNAVYVDGVQVYGAEEKYWNRVVAGVMGNPNGMVVEGWGGDVSYFPLSNDLVYFPPDNHSVLSDCCGGLFDKYQKLESSERKYVFSLPPWHQAHITEISMWAQEISNLIVPMTEMYSDGTTSGDINNAYRHFIWQAVITKELDANMAFGLGWAHEQDRTIVDVNDTKADFYNNQVARQWMLEHPNFKTREQIARAGIDMLASGQLQQVVRTVGEEETGLASSCLTAEQYNIYFQRVLNLKR
jgi:RHS repeat-associated protein